MIEFDKTYDSHVHFFGVGIQAVEWFIKENDFSVPKNLLEKKIIKGFGLKLHTSKADLYQLHKNYPNHQFCLSYLDGHSSLVSKSLIEEFKFKPKAHKEHSHFISLYEKERDEFLKLLPKRDLDELEKMGLFAIKYFTDRGVSRVRHMTCSIDQWIVLQKIYSNHSKPKLEIECLFAEFMTQNLSEAFSALDFAKKNPINGVTAQGIKLFVDGSIGQKTAYMSNMKSSLPRLSKKELFERMKEVLVEKKISLALHTIGDLALEMALETYSELSSNYGSLKTLHLEHAPVFTKKSLKLLNENSLNCVFHFQPSHWISDSKWYEAESQNLAPHKIYPFEELSEYGYKYYMGSDAPIEESLTDLTLKGLDIINNTKKERLNDYDS